MKHILLCITVIFSCWFNAFAQYPYPKDYFISPIALELKLVGNFGEIRPDHFHSGIDISTEGKEGFPIYAIADGFVSRINISPYGYGKAIYVDHPNGYTSVYAHLKSFNPTIGNFAKNIQYLKESFDIDTLLSPLLFVKKGDIIGYSGNSGSSQGPHLHVEIRDTKTEMPINPLLFGYKIKDDVPPHMISLTIYPLSASSSINGKQKTKKMEIKPDGEFYTVDKSDTLIIHGETGFGIECFDTETGSTNPNAVFSIELQSGGRRMYYAEFEKFAFEDTRYVNTHIDFSEKEINNIKIQKCFVSKNNQLGIYKGLRNYGIMNFNDNSDHWMRIILKDIAGNTSTLIFKVKGTTAEIIAKDTALVSPEKPYCDALFNCEADNYYKDDNIEVSIPINALYDDVFFTINKFPKNADTYSPVYRIKNKETAIHIPYLLKIKANNLPVQLQKKAVVVTLTAKGNYHYIGGNYADGWVIANPRVFGSFTVVTDTSAPNINPSFKIHAKNVADFSTTNEIRITIVDNLSGINTYRGTIDNRWVLFEYDAKSNVLTYTFDERIKSGNHTLRLEVTDNTDNKSNLEVTFKK